MQVDWYHRRAVPVTGSTRSRLWHVQTSSTNQRLWYWPVMLGLGLGLAFGGLGLGLECCGLGLAGQVLALALADVVKLQNINSNN